MTSGLTIKFEGGTATIWGDDEGFGLLKDLLDEAQREGSAHHADGQSLLMVVRMKEWAPLP